MEQYPITFLPEDRTVQVRPGTTVLQAMIRAGLTPDAPCGGRGSCGKCRVILADGSEALACRTIVSGAMTVRTGRGPSGRIAAPMPSVAVQPDGESWYALAYDVGTTTVVCCLLDGTAGAQLAEVSCMNPQVQFGADVISRIQYAMDVDAGALASSIRGAMASLALEACGLGGIAPEQIDVVSIAGNTAMHHLLLQIDPRPLTVPPYMPKIAHALQIPAHPVLPVCPNAVLRVLPNIAGFVGADTVGCMTAARFDRVEALSLLIDIGTNGEMVLSSSSRRIACSTAAGPAFEGARIRCGMRGIPGAVDHVRLEGDALRFGVIGGGAAEGLCGSGLLDLTACLLARGDMDETGRFREKKPIFLEGTPVFLTQKDVREVQLAKAAIRAGIELLCRQMGVRPADIRQVYLAGAFGNYLSPASACAIGMIPPVLLDRIRPIGNAACAGAKLCALSREEFEYSARLASGTEFLELASVPGFNECYLDCLTFEEDGE